MTALLTQPSATAVPTPAASSPIDPLWYRNAVIYQMHVRSFADSDGDGIGDFKGLISKLDYLEELGVTAIWLLPFYPSPLRDDGYDISDYTSVNPMYGNVEDAKQFIEEAHRRGLRVITELVINHTSDQHAWFQKARRAPKGSPERDFYVWSDSPKKYEGVRVIFKDFEPSNWTYDNVAQQYFWHRFFNHQPDLNFDNPAVHEAVFKVCDFWMAAGIDGVRLDAVPYLYEREGTSCENLEETHEFLRKFRKHVDTHWPGRMLLAEANQWPEDAIAYFGKTGDECHMNFHFPLMPRLFMSLRMEDRYPIIDILEQTPPIPANSQWAIFLRNHDELTLEMVTDEERDYMWRVYANDTTARINLGIRRRLAPLLDNNRRKIELMNGLLFSMPGSPIIYYGDEIGMGDNIFLADRNGVRTPMQWSGDRNAGFSKANPQRLVMPVVIDPEYNYETVNVETQAANPSSLLWWMRRLVALRKNHPVFGRGDIHFLLPANGKVLAFLRRDDQESVLCVANLSRFAQPVELDLSAYKGSVPVEMFGNVRFPAVPEDGKYTLSVSAHGFYWFVLEPANAAAGAAPSTPKVALRGSSKSILEHAGLSRALETHLPRLLPFRRWFVSKAKTIRGLHISEKIPFSSGPVDSTAERSLVLFDVEFTEGEPETYALPISVEPIASEDDSIPHDPKVLLHVTTDDGKTYHVVDGMTDPDFARALVEMATEGGSIAGQRCRLVGRKIGSKSLPDNWPTLPIKLPTAEQSNSNVIVGDQAIFKMYRRIADGVNPELELGEHLTRVGFSNTAPILGAIEIIRPGRPKQTLSVVLGFVPNQGDAWAAFLDASQRYYEGLDALSPDEAAKLCVPGDAGCSMSMDDDVPKDVASLIAEPLEWARTLGQRTAEMHAALADDSDDAAFTPEPYGLTYQRGLLQSMRNVTRTATQTLAARLFTLDGESKELAERLAQNEAGILKFFHGLTSRSLHASRIRIHGDYHLGQVLWTGKDFLIIDFEGEPLRSVGERRLKRSPLRDVAGMIRSFDYAAWSGLKLHSERFPALPGSDIRERGRRGAMVWSGWLSKAFLQAYFEQLKESRPQLMAGTQEDADLILQSWILEKALYEVRYELNSRPDWAAIPLRAVLSIIGVDAAVAPPAPAPIPAKTEPVAPTTEKTPATSTAPVASTTTAAAVAPPDKT